MSAGATKWAWENSRASNGSLIVLLAIADECGEGEFTEMSVARLAQKCRLSDRAVRMAVKDLAALGELSVEPAKGGIGRYAPRQNLPDHPGKICRTAKSAPRQNLPDLPEEPQVKATPAKSAGPEKPDVFSSSTGSSLVEVKETPAKPPTPPSRPDVDRLCQHLADRIVAKGSKQPVVGKKWRDAARLLIDKDERTEEQVHACIDWSQDDEFWRVNIDSMPTLRKQYDRLRLDAIRKLKSQRRNSRQPDEADQREALEIARQLDAMEAM